MLKACDDTSPWELVRSEKRKDHNQEIIIRTRQKCSSCCDETKCTQALRRNIIEKYNRDY